jgi:hypothetical protein
LLVPQIKLVPLRAGYFVYGLPPLQSFSQRHKALHVPDGVVKKTLFLKIASLDLSKAREEPEEVVEDPDEAGDSARLGVYIQKPETIDEEEDARILEHRDATGGAAEPFIICQRADEQGGAVQFVFWRFASFFISH